MIQLMMLAACGWLLLVPGVPDETRPLFEWDQKGAFETVQECESERKQYTAWIRDIVTKKSRQQQGRKLNEEERATNAALWANMKARCVPSDALLSPPKR